jgi:hypothetical protein
VCAVRAFKCRMFHFKPKRQFKNQKYPHFCPLGEWVVFLAHYWRSQNPDAAAVDLMASSSEQGRTTFQHVQLILDDQLSKD